MATKNSIKTTVVLSSEDVANPLHPTLWQEICEQLGLKPLPSGQWPTELQIATRSVEAHY